MASLCAPFGRKAHLILSAPRKKCDKQKAAHENRLQNVTIISREFSTNIKMIIKINRNNFEKVKDMLIYTTNNMIKITIL